MNDLLKPLGWLYAGGILIWDLLWVLGIRRSRSLPVPVISVGSLFAGGSGKTPLTAWLANRLLNSGWRPVILSRGYGRKEKNPRIVWPEKAMQTHWHEVGDEPIILTLQSQCPVAVHASRFQAWKTFINKGGQADVVLLDDGFQYRSMKRDLDLVLIDGISWRFYRDYLPAGRRREPLNSLKRAGCIIITKIERVNHRRDIKRELSKYISGKPSFYIDFKIQTFLLWNGERLIPGEPPRENGLFVASIAYPEAFFQELMRYGLVPRDTWKRADHAPWSRSDVDYLIMRCQKTGSDYVLTTMKDWVKLRHYSLSIPLWVADFSVSEAFDEQPFLDYLLEHLASLTRTRA